MTTSSFSCNNVNNRIPQEMATQIQNIIETLCAPITTNGASIIRKEIINRLHECGWSNAVKLDTSSNISITGIKENIGICVQLGNVSRVYADLIKLQTLFLRSSINAGIIILPSSIAARSMGQNMANSERLRKEIRIFSTVITMPLLIINFNNDKEKNNES